MKAGWVVYLYLIGTRYYFSSEDSRQNVTLKQGIKYAHVYDKEEDAEVCKKKLERIYGVPVYVFVLF